MNPAHAEINSPAAQERRRSELYTLHRTILPRVFAPDGTYLGPMTETPMPRLVKAHELDPRVALWHAFAAFAGDAQSIRLGNAILRKTAFLPDYDFGMTALVQLYRRYANLFEPDITDKARAALEATGPEQMDSCGYVGMNDNFASMAVSVLIHAGELTGRRELVARGNAIMRDLVGRLDTHGAIAEFNSPTYTPITQCCMADIVTYATDPEARRLALRIEQQTWYDLCARYHPESSNMAGPSSRAYTAESSGHMHNARWLWQVAFGESVAPLSPKRFSFGQSADLVLHHNDPAFIPANGAWIAAAEFHIPDACARMVLEPVRPQTSIGTAAPATLWRPDDWRRYATGPEHDRFRNFVTLEYGTSLQTTHMTEDYALSTGAGALACGRGSQHDVFFATWRRRVPTSEAPLDMADTRTAYARYSFNDKAPSTEKGLVEEEGWPTCVQHNSTALVLYRPGTETVRGITQLCVSIIMPLHRSEPDGIWIGDRRLPNLEGESIEPQTVFVRDGRVALAFRPLDLTDYGRAVAVRVRRAERFLTIHFYNYEGPARSLNFPQMAALFTTNGFAVEMETVQDDGAFARFRAMVNGAALSDMFTGPVRTVSYEREAVSLRIDHRPGDILSIPRAFIHGTPRLAPRFEATGISGLPAFP